MAHDWERRFWEKVKRGCGPKGDCWEWQGSTDRFGYGRARKDGREWKAHRLSYTLTVGEIPLGRLLRHSCDTPPCVNPDHLTPGTYKQNVDDCIHRGRRRYPKGDEHGARKHRDKRPRGEYIPLSVLNDTLVMEIRRRYAAGGVRMDELARDYGVTQSNISNVVRGVTWAHLPVLPRSPRRAPNAKPRVTHCANGHEYNEANAYHYTNAKGYDRWTCKQCQLAMVMAKYQYAAPRTHCQRGHELTEANTYHINGRRRCRKCSALRQQGYCRKRKSNEVQSQETTTP